MDRPPEVAQRVRAALELLRPHPHRGDVIAAGAVPLTLALLLIEVRLDGPWGSGILLVLEALGAALLLGMAVLAPREGERPRVYALVLQLSGLVLLLVALWRLADVLGVDDPLDAAGTLCWIFSAFAGAAAWLAARRRSAPCALVAALGALVAVLAFVEWVFDPSGAGTARWLLLALALGFAAGALSLRDRRRRESVYLVDAAGVAVVVLALTWVGAAFLNALTFGDAGAAATPGAGWKLVLVAAGLGLVAYAAVDREPGPAWLGTVVLALFVVLVGGPGADGPSLWFWPLALLLAGGALIAVGLRPRAPLPPEPDRPDGPGEAVRGRFGDDAPPARGALWTRPARAADADAPTEVRRPDGGMAGPPERAPDDADGPRR